MSDDFLPEPPDDPESGRETVRLGRSYVRLLAPIVLCAVVVAAGVLGRLTSASPAPTAGPTDAATLPAPEFAATEPPIDATARPEALSLGANVTSLSLAAAGGRLFYISGTNTVMVLPLVPDGIARPVLTAPPCDEIESLAATTTTLLYVELTPAGPADSGCPTIGFEWHLRAIDLRSATVRDLANGSEPATPVWAGSGVTVAVGKDEYAFGLDHAAGLANASALPSIPPSAARPAPAAGASRAEVHSLTDGKLLWAATVVRPIDRLMLGGGRLAILTVPPAPELYVSTAASPTAALVSKPSSGANLSADGRYVAWDEPGSGPDGLVNVQLLDLASGARHSVGTAAAPPAPESVQPVVGLTSAGPAVAWFTYRGGGWTIPSYVDSAHPEPTPLASRDAPVWLSIDGTNLVWVVASEDHVGRALIADLRSGAIVAP